MCLKSRISIVREPTHLGQEILNNIVRTCEILNNMIIKDEGDLDLKKFFNNDGRPVKPNTNLDRVKTLTY